MGIQVCWDDDAQTIIRYDYDQHWTWEDWSAAENSVIEMLKGVDHAVDAIINTPPDIVLPRNFLSGSLSAEKHRNKVVTRYAIVGVNSLGRMLVSTFSKMMRNGPKIILLSSVEEARIALMQRDGSQSNAGRITP